MFDILALFLVLWTNIYLRYDLHIICHMLFDILGAFESAVLTFSHQIDWENRLDYFLPTSGVFEDHTFCVDGTECQIARPGEKAKERLHWSMKSKTPCVRYEGSSKMKFSLRYRIH